MDKTPLNCLIDKIGDFIERGIWQDTLDPEFIGIFKLSLRRWLRINFYICLNDRSVIFRDFKKILLIQCFIDSLPLTARLGPSAINLELSERRLIPPKHDSIQG